MPMPRKRLVSLSDTPYYHCINRCVRRAFLCGVDPISGYDFEHRRQWIVDRIHLLSSVFTIDICAYAVMSNHYHLVLHIDSPSAQRLTDDEVAKRWLSLFRAPPAIQRWQQGNRLSFTEKAIVRQWLETMRSRLQDLSWFMRCLNEPIARMANAEDECTGRFWEGRFKSQALLDMTAVLQCMAYVDLNPVRAGIASTLNESDFTSIQERLVGATHNTLLPFSSLTIDRSKLPFAEASYFELLEWGVIAALAGKNKAMETIPTVIENLHIDPHKMANFLLHPPLALPRALGSAQAMRCLARSVGLKFIHGVSGLHSILRDKKTRAPLRLA